MKTTKFVMATFLAFVCVSLPGSVTAEERVGEKFDYPTSARADYVFGCMAANGQTHETLNKCSCSIDIIAKYMPYETYEQAETIMRMQLVQGVRSAMFKNLPWMIKLSDQMKQLQAQSTLECF